MISNPKVALLGGDTRQLALANKLFEEGLCVRTFGLPHKENRSQIQAFEHWQDAISGARGIIFPLPASPDGKRLNQPLLKEKDAPLLEDIFSAVPTGVFVAGGKFTPSMKAIAEQKNVTLFDYFECEELQIKNALPTAEGAVSILMREIPRTVKGLSVGVTGYGRVAKALVELLLAMGARVTVTARKAEDVQHAATRGCDTIRLNGKHALELFAREQTVIFNTVPYWLFCEEVLERMSDKTLIIDLASAPGGVDANAANAHGIKVIWALSLPGKYAPVTAGEIIAETVLSYMEKEGVL